MSEVVKSTDYRQWIVLVKQRVKSSQIKASIAVNRELLELYWFLGEQILEKQHSSKWGDGFLKQMSQDLLTEFPAMKGFSHRNLKYMRQWVRFWSQPLEIGPQAAAQLDTDRHGKPSRGVGPQVVAQMEANPQRQVLLVPWGHNRVIMDKLKAPTDAMFYIQKTIQNNWSRAVLTHQIESGLHEREGLAVNNFEATLPEPESDLARQLLRDPYNFDFLMLTERHNERELENGLLEHMTNFLLELGAGFAFVGRQRRIEVDGDEFFIDLLNIH